VWALIADCAPLLALAALSPVMFLNASRITSVRGTSGGLQFAAGGAGVLLVIGMAGALLGATAAQVVERELASRSVDVVLAVVLIGYGLRQLGRQLSEPPGAHGAGTLSVPEAGGPCVVNGVLGMATNITSLPLFLSVAQRLGTSGEPLVLRVLLLLASVLVVALPAWTPVALAAVLPSRHDLAPATRARVQQVTGWVSVGACLLGGVLILWRVLAAVTLR
jgi:hypothetical protein